jgi:hypothetical protein
MRDRNIGSPHIACGYLFGFDIAFAHGEGIVVKPFDSSAVTQAEQTRSGFDPFEGRLFCPFLIFKNGVFVSVIVNEFEFIYLVRFFVFHSASPVAIDQAASWRACGS